MIHLYTFAEIIYASYFIGRIIKILDSILI